MSDVPTPQEIAHDEAELLRIWRQAPRFGVVTVQVYRGRLNRAEIVQSIKPAPLTGAAEAPPPGRLRAVGDPGPGRIREGD